MPCVHASPSRCQKDTHGTHEQPIPVIEASGKLRRFRDFHPERENEAWRLTATKLCEEHQVKQATECEMDTV